MTTNTVYAKINLQLIIIRSIKIYCIVNTSVSVIQILSEYISTSIRRLKWRKLRCVIPLEAISDASVPWFHS